MEMQNRCVHAETNLKLDTDFFANWNNKTYSYKVKKF